MVALCLRDYNISHLNRLVTILASFDGMFTRLVDESSTYTHAATRSRPKSARMKGATVEVGLTVGAALLDMEEYWRDGLLGRELMWETRWESEKEKRMRYRDISAFLAERLPNDMHEAAEVLQEDAKFTELDPTTASEIRKFPKLSRFSVARRMYHTPRPLDESWKAIAQQKVERHHNGYEIDDYQVRRFIRVIDGDWQFVTRDTQILVYLRQSKTNGVDVVGTRQWLPLILRGP